MNTAERQRYDLFRPKNAGGSSPLVAFIHGGYWQRGDRKDNIFLARELNARGITVALPSYTLCPAAKVADIVAEMQRFLKAVWERTNERPVVVGHSAGGHLAAAMLATDWSKVGGVPSDLVRSAYALSGVFDLAPLIGTSINEALSLTKGTARAASPLFRPPPPRGKRLLAAVGGEESAEFHRQSREIAENWSKVGVAAEWQVIADTNHFTIVDELARPGSALLTRIVGMAHEAA